MCKGEDHNLSHSEPSIVVDSGNENVSRIRDESSGHPRHVTSNTCYPKLLNSGALIFGPLKNLAVEKINGMLKCRKHKHGNCKQIEDQISDSDLIKPAQKAVRVGGKAMLENKIEKNKLFCSSACGQP